MNSSLLSIQELCQRVVGTQAAEQFNFVLKTGEKKESYEIESKNGKIEIVANTLSALSMGLNHYLKHEAHLYFTWYGYPLQVPSVMPQVRAKIRHESWAKDRYFLNYCCFSYSTAYWDWTQWERLIDWMALNGINRPLAIVGQEAVWLKVGARLGLTSEKVLEFLPGSAYLPFGFMGCLDGWGGPLTQDWCDSHEKLGQKIIQQEIALGMTPVLQGFTGHIPQAFLKTRQDIQCNPIHWLEWETAILDPMDPVFLEVAQIYMEEQTAMFGSQLYYAADAFIEMVPPSTDLQYLAKLGKAIYDGISQNTPQATWVFQGWPFMQSFIGINTFWNTERIASFLQEIPDDKILILDLYCDVFPMWNKTNAFSGKTWLWCNVQNFGGNSNLSGSLEATNNEVSILQQNENRGRLNGVGIVNEGLCYNPVAYDFFFEQPWRSEPVEMDSWIENYVHYRYGQSHPEALAAWKMLYSTVYAKSTYLQNGMSQYYAITNHPCFIFDYKKKQCYKNLLQALKYLLNASLDFEKNEPYRFDVVNLTRQILSNYSVCIVEEIHRSLAQKDLNSLNHHGTRLRELFLDLDGLLNSRSEFLLGRWIEDAKRWGKNIEETKKLEWNARRQLTLWGHGKEAILHDYACKEWGGMMKDFYLQRWEKYLESSREALQNSTPFDPHQIKKELLDWELSWSNSDQKYSTTPQGDSLQISKRLFKKYESQILKTEVLS